MSSLDLLKQTLERAENLAGILERQKAGYTKLTMPAHLELELYEKHKEINSLKIRIQQIQGLSVKDLPSNLPRSENFFGRSEQIERCLEALDPQVRGWGVVIDGIGGVGKTALAVEVAHKAREQALFDAYLYVSAKTTWLSVNGVRPQILSNSSLDAFCREFARLLNEIDIVQISDAKKRRQALLNVLKGRRALLIWDNLETLTSDERNLISSFLTHLPIPNKAIITSRYRTGESAITIRLDRLFEEEVKSMVKALGKRNLRLHNELISSDESTYHTLYEASGGNPLALEWTLGLVSQKAYSLQGALKCLKDANRSGDLYAFLFADAVQDLAKADKDILVTLATFNNPATTNALADSTSLDSTDVSKALERLVTLSLVNDLDGGLFGLHPLTRNFVNTALKSNDERLQTGSLTVEMESSSQRTALHYLVNYAQKYGDGKKESYKTFEKLDEKWTDLEGIATSLYDLTGLSSD